MCRHGSFRHAPVSEPSPDKNTRRGCSPIDPGPQFDLPQDRGSRQGCFLLPEPGIMPPTASTEGENTKMLSSIRTILEQGYPPALPSEPDLPGVESDADSKVRQPVLNCRNPLDVVSPCQRPLNMRHHGFVVHAHNTLAAIGAARRAEGVDEAAIDKATRLFLPCTGLFLNSG